MKRIIIALSLMMVMMMGMVTPVSAAETDEPVLIASGNSNDCYCIRNKVPAGVVISRCHQEKIDYGTDTHGYGFAWQNTCTYRVYKSTGRDFCSKCGYVYLIGGPHFCEAKHGQCGKGTENVCPIGVKDPWDVVHRRPTDGQETE